ncbi:MAG: hypothetical protein J6C87_05710 [Bacteroides sp.]|nr:hypothetical protein [Bacteroides sp.]
MNSLAKKKAIDSAKKMLADKREVVRWIRTKEPYETLVKKGIVLGRIGE